MTQLRCASRWLDLSEPVVMGIFNVTPDSFSDGGLRFGRGQDYLRQCVAQAEQMIADGAGIIDIGGESTRPGALPVSEQEELDRVIPVVEAIARELDVCISVDTSNAQVITESFKAGAHIINDVRSLQRDGALAAACATDMAVCLMHRQGEPQTMQQAPHYDDVVNEVEQWLLAEVDVCLQAGISADRLLLDPGFGFGKTAEHNLSLLKHLDRWQQFPYPLLVGVSRKSLAGTITGRPVGERLAASLALAYEGLQRGAKVLRVHDVAETADIVKVWQAVNRAQ